MHVLQSAQTPVCYQAAWRLLLDAFPGPFRGVGKATVLMAGSKPARRRRLIPRLQFIKYTTAKNAPR